MFQTRAAEQKLYLLDSEFQAGKQFVLFAGQRMCMIMKGCDPSNFENALLVESVYFLPAQGV